MEVPVEQAVDSLADLHRTGRRKDSVPRLAMLAHSSTKQAQAVLDYWAIPERTRLRVETLIRQRNG